MVGYNSDPGESSYWDTKKRTFDFLEDVGYDKPGIIPSDKSNFLYYYKQALKFGNLKVAEKYLKKYMDAGGSLKGMKISIKMSSPLGGIPKKHRNAFLASLDEKQKESLRRAQEWYNKTYSGSVSAPSMGGGGIGYSPKKRKKKKAMSFRQLKMKQ